MILKYYVHLESFVTYKPFLYDPNIGKVNIGILILRWCEYKDVAAPCSWYITLCFPTIFILYNCCVAINWTLAGREISEKGGNGEMCDDTCYNVLYNVGTTNSEGDTFLIIHYGLPVTSHAQWKNAGVLNCYRSLSFLLSFLIPLSLYRTLYTWEFTTPGICIGLLTNQIWGTLILSLRKFCIGYLMPCAWGIKI